MIMALLAKSDVTPMTADELFQRPDLEPCELVAGKWRPLVPTGFTHGDLEYELGLELRSWAKRTGKGKVVGGEVGLYVRRDPDTVRAADILFISHERLARRGPSPYLDVPPELVVEILSPDDRWSDVMEKLEGYFSAGIDRVWLVDARLRKISVYRSLNEVETLGEEDLLQDEEILPGFPSACRSCSRAEGRSHWSQGES
jgi:Uma2 family endonuclease